MLSPRPRVTGRDLILTSDSLPSSSSWLGKLILTSFEETGRTAVLRRLSLYGSFSAGMECEAVEGGDCGGGCSW